MRSDPGHAIEPSRPEYESFGGGSRLSRAQALLILVAILVVAGFLRFTGLNWDEGQYIHPDEGHMRNTLSLIKWPDDLSVYFDTHSSPLNVRNHEGRRYSYGTLPLFLARAAAEWLDRACSSEPAPASRALGALLVGRDVIGCRPGAFTGVHNATVGRTLSAFSDLGTLVLVYLLGRRLYGEVTGLLAAALGAVTAFLIQQAHFFTVESMACLFVTLVAYFSVRAARGEGAEARPQADSESRTSRATGRGVRWFDFAIAGVGVGLAAACKVSAATSALLVLLAGAQVGVSQVLEEARRPGRNPGHGFRSSHLVTLLLALSLAGLLSLVVFRVAQPYAFEGPRFLGLRPSPEWFGRLQEIRREQSGEIDLPSGRQWAHRSPILFPWVNIVVWGMGLPLGLAGWIGWGLEGRDLLAETRQHRKRPVLWGWFTILFLYHGTRWVKSMRYFLHLYPVLLLFAAALLVRLVRSSRRPGRPMWLRSAGAALPAVVGVGAIMWGIAFFSIYLRPHPRVAASRWIYEHVPAGDTLANEHWDWGLPLRLNGHDPFGGTYVGIEMDNYNEDTLDKRQRLLDSLDEADWIFLASNRLYASIPRIPSRYPLTTEYYRALFAGELGFELEADFASYPALGPFVFPDQENPFPLMEARHESLVGSVEVRLPPAEEAFSVYDHPRVLIFRKTEAYSRHIVQQVLGDIELARVQLGRTPRQATRAPDLLRFDEETWAEQRAGGTWSQMFDRDCLLNRYPGLAAVAWWACLTALGWLVFPLMFVSLPQLRDRGYAFSRVLALLLIAYLTWLAASLRLFPNTRLTIVRMVGLLTITGLGVAWLKRTELGSFLKRNWAVVLAVEGLFAFLFLMWIGVRMLQPDLWHPSVGGEKPMDFAYLNAVMKSTWFPPYNPWLSRTWINYYYYGFVIVGTWIKLIGTVPSIAYNLVVPLLFALTGVGAFSAAYNLARVDRRGAWRRQALLAGMAASVFIVLIGNLGVVHLIRGKLIALGDVSFVSTIPGLPNFVSMLRGLWRVAVEGATLTMRPETWYWHPTRIIPAEAGNPITEFPAFTFLYGDLHAHMIAFPLTLFALALAVAWAHARRPVLGSLILGGLVIGGLQATNTWDYPTYLLIGVLALGLGAWRERERKASLRSSGAYPNCRSDRRETQPSLVQGSDASGSRISRVPAEYLGAFIRRAALPILALIGLTVLLYLPYTRHYVSGYNSLRLWEGGRTPVEIYLWIHALLLFPVVTHLVARVVEKARHRRVPRIVAAVVALGTLFFGAALWMLRVEIGLISVPTVALAMVVLLAPMRTGVGRETAEQRRQAWRGKLLWVVVLAAMLLTLMVEILVLEGDIGRMNTVFKFYLQVWILLSVAAAVSVSWIGTQAQVPGVGQHRLWWAIMSVLVFGGALFLPCGVRGRAIDRMAPETGLTLDGMAFMERASIHDGPENDLRQISLTGDYHAIRWLQDSVEGSPVILEGLGRREYLWASRVSVYTGLPAVAGWRWHEVQQRAGVESEMVGWQRADVNACYATSSVAEAREILERYDVQYVYVGPYERAYYPAAGLSKFDGMVDQGLLLVAYDGAGVTIYEVVERF